MSAAWNSFFAHVPSPYYLVQTTDGRGAYEKTTKDLFLFYNDVIKAWCISSEMQDGLSQVTIEKRKRKRKKEEEKGEM
jgi:hypothetical protein